MANNDSQKAAAKLAHAKTFFAMLAVEMLSLISCVTYLVVTEETSIVFWTWLTATLVFGRLKNRWSRRRVTELEDSSARST